MERITPIDLEAARFPIVRKGYDTGAVDAMLKTAAAELQSLIREVQELKRQHETEQKELELYRRKESTLADSTWAVAGPTERTEMTERTEETAGQRTAVTINGTPAAGGVATPARPARGGDADDGE